MLLAVDFARDKPKEVVIVAPSSRQEAEPLLSRLRATFLPNRVLAVAVQGDDLTMQARLVPLRNAKMARGGKTTAYVCEGWLCRSPTTDPEAFLAQIQMSGARPRPR